MLRLVTDSIDDPAVDTAVSTVLLRRVGTGQAPPTLRVFTPGRVVAFGRQDAVRPGYARAVASVEDLGYAAIERLAGGKAAVFHEGTLAFAWAMPTTDPRGSIGPRFEAIAGIVVDALVRLGVDARVGEVPGEYCPGAYSVNARGRHKLMGVGQRLVRGAAHVGGVIVIERPDLVNLPLIPAYADLGYEWDPGATGSITDEVDTTIEEVRDSLIDSFARAGHEMTGAPLDPDVVSDAAALASGHEIA